MNPGISYAITTHNEFIQLEKSIGIIESYLSDNDEMVFLDDFSDNKKTQKLLENKNVFQRKFQKNYAEHKNYLNSVCKKDYIFQLDGDEFPTHQLMKNIKNIICNHADTDLFYIPRANYIQQINKKYLKKWNWRIDNKQRVNYPDYQGRIYKNTERLKWTRDVHERIRGHYKFSKLPTDANLDIVHEKHIQKQIDNNNFYNENYNTDCSRK